MRQEDITEIIIHCAATPEGVNFDINDIRKWHVDERGWSDVGYHYIILLDGTIQKGRPTNKQGAHCLGHNSKSIGVCYIGGVDKYSKSKDTRTDAQKVALKALVFMIKDQFKTISSVHGHNEFSKKACPSFDVSKEF